MKKPGLFNRQKFPPPRNCNVRVSESERKDEGVLIRAFPDPISRGSRERTGGGISSELERRDKEVVGSGFKWLEGKERRRVEEED